VGGPWCVPRSDQCVWVAIQPARTPHQWVPWCVPRSVRVACTARSHSSPMRRARDTNRRRNGADCPRTSWVQTRPRRANICACLAAALDESARATPWSQPGAPAPPTVPKVIRTGDETNASSTRSGAQGVVVHRCCSGGGRCLLASQVGSPVVHGNLAIDAQGALGATQLT
jgi:hypothetical protein